MGGSSAMWGGGCCWEWEGHSKATNARIDRRQAKVRTVDGVDLLSLPYVARFGTYGRGLASYSMPCSTTREATRDPAHCDVLIVENSGIIPLAGAPP